MTDTIIWVQPNANLALQNSHRLSQTFVKIFFNPPQCELFVNFFFALQEEEGRAKIVFEDHKIKVHGTHQYQNFCNRRNIIAEKLFGHTEAISVFLRESDTRDLYHQVMICKKKKGRSGTNIIKKKSINLTFFTSCSKVILSSAGFFQILFYGYFGCSKIKKILLLYL